MYASRLRFLDKLLCFGPPYQGSHEQGPFSWLAAQGMKNTDRDF